jgi:hypothetical protein
MPIEPDYAKRWRPFGAKTVWSAPVQYQDNSPDARFRGRCVAKRTTARQRSAGG